MITADNDFLVTMQDVRLGGACPSAKAFCAAHGINWAGFIRRGMMASELLEKSNNDALAVQVIVDALKRRGRE